MRCPHCATRVEEGTRVCPHCDLALTPRKRRAGRPAEPRQDVTDEIPQTGLVPPPPPPSMVARPPVRREQQRHRDAYRQEIAPEYGEAAELIRVRRPQDRSNRSELSGVKINLEKRPFNWAMGVILVLAFLLVVSITGVVLLTQTDTGRVQLAAWGYEVDLDTRWKLGDLRLREGYIGQALEIYQAAYDENPDDLEGAMKLGTVYERNGQDDMALALYQSLVDNPKYKHYPEPYERLIEYYRDQGDHEKAIELMELGIASTEDNRFASMLKSYVPEAPYADPIGGRFTEDETVTLTATGQIEIYYFIEDPSVVQARADDYEAAVAAAKEAGDPAPEKPKEPNPMEVGQLYTGPIPLTEGRYTLTAVAVQQNNIPSKIMSETYTVEYPRPQAPTATLASGTYEKQHKVGIRSPDPGCRIYYTLDDTTPTQESAEYISGEMFQLPIGKSTLRAIAVDKRGKVSNEMSVGYNVKANLKKAFNAEDVIGKFSLMKTTIEQFKKAQGEPQSYEPIPGENGEECYEARYDFGLARFVSEGDSQVLYELQLTGGSLTGPRKVKLGTEMADVLALYRDRARQPNDKGERVLYDDEESKLGVLTREENGNLAAHYYYPRGVNDYVELSFYFNAGGVLERIVWLRYVGDSEG